MIYFTCFSHFLYLLFMAPTLPGPSPPPGPGLEISIEHFPDSIVIPVCSATEDITFHIRIEDKCFGVPDPDELTFNGSNNLFAVPVAGDETSVLLQVTFTISLALNGQTWTFGIPDSQGIIREDSVTLQVTQAQVVQAPVITIPENLHYTIPFCDTSVFGLLGFQITDDCTPVDIQLAIFDDAGANLNPIPIVVQNDPNSVYWEVFGDFTAGVYNMTMTYQGVVETFTITVTQELQPNPVPRFPENLDWVITDCENDMYANFSITINSWCSGTYFSSDFIFRLVYLEGPPVPIVPILVNGGYMEFLETFSLFENGAVIKVYYENMFEPIGISPPISVDYCGPCPPFVECEGDCAYSTGSSDCLVDIPVYTPEILGDVDSITLHAAFMTEIEVAVLDDNGEPTGEYITEEIVLESLDTLEGSLADFANTLGTFHDIPPGHYQIRYTVTNSNGTTIVNCPVKVIDNSPPTIVCNDHLSVIVNGDETARYYAWKIDDGSFDNCGPIKREVRRSHPVNENSCDSIPVTFGDWGSYIEFTSCDIGQLVTIELRVWDDKNQDGIPGNRIGVERCNGNVYLTTDNYAVCSIEEVVETLLHPWSMVDTKSELDQLDQTSTFQLLQNAPNPFSERTLIGFRIPAETQVGLKVHDLNGRTLHSFEARFEEGYHEVPINKADLQASGVLFYTLETADFTATRKMVVLE